MANTTTGITLRRARVEDVPGIAAVMARYVEDGSLLPRSTGELYRSIREFHVALDEVGSIIGCAALRILWRDMGEVRSLAVRPDAHGKGLGAALVAAVVEDARSIGLPRVIALTREVGFFERVGFKVADREHMPRKVWTDCVMCPRRHACDEIAVEMDLVPGASQKARERASAWRVPVGGPTQAAPQTAPEPSQT
ncbi:MAG: N-acetyltransferase [Candidatus Eiseniibacteriota bacterium]